jgi:Ycf66 protein N-terminus
MLAYFLSVLVGTSSVGIYVAAFLFPEIYRKYDFIWSGLGLFYALVLWLEARQLTGGLLIGQTASVVLLLWFGWQAMILRRQLSATNTPIASPPALSTIPASPQPEISGVVAPPQPWIEIRQEFPATKSSTATPQEPTGESSENPSE